MDGRFDQFFNKLKCGAKVNIPFGFIFIKEREDWGFRYLYAHEERTLLDQSIFMCTNDDLAKLKDILKKIDVIESYSRERKNPKWSFYKLTNSTTFAALLKDVPMSCKDVVLLEPLLKNCTINCFTYEEKTRKLDNDNLCLSRAPALHLKENQ